MSSQSRRQGDSGRASPARAPRVIATDLDGTLLRTDGTVSPRSIAALQRARSAGAYVVLVTARPPRTVERIFVSAGWLDALAICSNGALVFDLAGRVVKRVTALAPEVAASATRSLTRLMPELAWSVETGVELVTGPGWRHDFSDDAAQAARASTLAELLRYPTVKLIASSGRRSADEMLAVARRARLTGVEVTHSGGDRMIELATKGVSKGRALSEQCLAWGIASTDVVSFGDMPNDVPVLTWAGRSWAVSNAHPEAMAAATNLTATNDEDGVAKVLEKLYVRAE